jgi:mRNA interferase MazF
MSPGEIYWVDFPTANGHEQAGRRPSIILQDDNVGAILPVTLAVPMTTALAVLRYPGTVLVDATPQTGLRSRSVALVFQLRVVDRIRVSSRIGDVDATTLQQIFRAFDQLTGRIAAGNNP